MRKGGQAAEGEGARGEMRTKKWKVRINFCCRLNARGKKKAVTLFFWSEEISRYLDFADFDPLKSYKPSKSGRFGHFQHAFVKTKSK